MKAFLFFTWSVLFYGAFGNHEEVISDAELYPQKDGFVLLDRHNFLAALHRFKFVFVFYYGNNRESKNAEPELHKVFERLRSIRSVIHLAKIDADKEHYLLHEFPIHATPTLRLFKNGKRYDYFGKIESEKVLTWLDLAMNVPVQINTSHELQSLTKSTSVVLGCFPAKSPKAAFENFYKVSEYFVCEPHMPLPRFAVITSAQLARQLGVVSGSISVYKLFEEGAKVMYSGDHKDFAKVLKFAEEETFPLVFKMHIDEYVRKMHDKTHEYQHILFMNSGDRSYPDTFKNFREAAKDYVNRTEGVPNKVTFIHVDMKYTKHTEFVEYYHVDVKKDLPCNRIALFDKFHSRFVPRRQDFTSRGFKEFTEGVLKGEIKRSMRTETQPSDWNAYDVKVLVGKTFDTFVRDKDRTVATLLFIQNDATSETALPVFNEIAKEFKSNRSIIFGRMNIAKNDAELCDVSKIPCVKLFLTNGKTVTLKQELTTQTLKLFIMTSGTNQPMDSDSGYEEDISKYVDLQHPVQSVEEEERRKQEWEEEEKKYLDSAVTHQIGREPHDDPDLKDTHPLSHLPLEERDPKHMDPQKHADFATMHTHDEQHNDEL